MAPEAIMNLQFSTKSDIWSFGVTAYEIFIREEPFADREPVDVAMAVCRQNLKPTFPEKFPKELIGIFNKCFETNVDSRPTTTELINALQLYLDPTKTFTTSGNQYGSVTAVSKGKQPASLSPSKSQYGSVTTVSKGNQTTPHENVTSTSTNNLPSTTSSNKYENVTTVSRPPSTTSSNKYENVTTPSKGEEKSPLPSTQTTQYQPFLKSNRSLNASLKPAQEGNNANQYDNLSSVVVGNDKNIQQQQYNVMKEQSSNEKL